MTQPPQQWGAPAPPMYGWPPRRPPVLTLVSLLHWAFLSGTFVVAALAFVSVAMSGDRAFTSISFALVWAGFGLMNVQAVLSIDDPDFPSTVRSRWASFVTAFVFASVLFRSAFMGAAGPIEWTFMTVLLLVCFLAVFFVTRPPVKQWIAARQQLALSQGYRPRR